MVELYALTVENMRTQTQTYTFTLTGTLYIIYHLHWQQCHISENITWIVCKQSHKVYSQMTSQIRLRTVLPGSPKKTSTNCGQNKPKSSPITKHQKKPNVAGKTQRWQHWVHSRTVRRGAATHVARRIFTSELHKFKRLNVYNMPASGHQSKRRHR